MEYEEPAPPTYHITSVDHALQLLLLLKAKTTIRVAEAAEELGVARSTAHRLLGMLVYRGFAAQNPNTRAYRPGPVLIEVGMGALARLDVRRRARPYLERVAAITGETASLQILEGGQAHFVDSVESPNMVRVVASSGVSLPAHVTSGGKAMLAGLPERALRELYPCETIDGPLTTASIISRDALFKELDTVRDRGYSISQGESWPGLIAIGVALFDGDEMPVAALTVASPVARMGPEDQRRAITALREAARELEVTLYR